MSRRFAAILAYNGTPFAGFQRQKTAANTVQAAVEDVLSRFVHGEHVSIVGAGRTDAGVHARGQVIAFDLPWQATAQALQRALNAELPEAIAIKQLWQAQPGFHPRYDARARRYVYRVVNEPVRDPLRMGYAWHVSQPLDLIAMRRAASQLIGRYDFRAFGRSPTGRSTVREVTVAKWAQAAPDEYTFTVQANAFLYRMVRRMVGVQVDVGRGRISVDDIADLLDAPNGGVSLTLAPPHGLTLVSVEYASDRT